MLQNRHTLASKIWLTFHVLTTNVLVNLKIPTIRHVFFKYLVFIVYGQNMNIYQNGLFSKTLKYDMKKRKEAVVKSNLMK